MQPREIVPLVLDPPLNVTFIDKIEDLYKVQEFFNELRPEDKVDFTPVGFDLETTLHKDFYWRRVRTVQFGNNTRQIVVDLLGLCNGDPDILMACQGNYGTSVHLSPGMQTLLEILKPIICSNKWLKMGVNLGFEYMCMYWNFGLRMWHFWDCSQIERVIYAGAHSLKDYDFYSMEEMVKRYLGMQIDKTLQTSFTIDEPLTQEQVHYAALDTRLPGTLRGVQSLILMGRTTKNNTNKNNQKYFDYIDPQVTGDNLIEAGWIENNCVGSFTDMHLHGERIDRARWKTRVQKHKDALEVCLKNLDEVFLPLTGSKHDTVTQEEIDAAVAKWKIYAIETPEEHALGLISKEEMELKSRMRKESDRAGEYTAQLEALRFKRLSDQQLLKDLRLQLKEPLKKEASELGKKRTRIKNLAEKCEGDALVNYSSDAQLLKWLPLTQWGKQLKKIDALNEDTFAEYGDIPVISLIKEYHSLSKEIGTYGDAWAQEWVTHPCKEEGWLHPGDGRLHSVFNPFEAETGRSSSEKPNGQNLPTDPEIRGCFIADDPDESIRISDCCNAETVDVGVGSRVCLKCALPCSHHAQKFVIVTADMSGAELRIIAELANDPIWIAAFERGEDVHSVGTELLYPEKWPTLTEEGCAYFKINSNTGQPARQKCKCKGHKKLRDGTKAVNFLLAYGGGPGKLAESIGVTLKEAKELMAIHKEKFPRVWQYLEESGYHAKLTKKSFDLFNGRRLFRTPTTESAREYFIDNWPEKLEIDDDLQEVNVAKYITDNGKKPDKETEFWLTHREPTQKEIVKAMMAQHGSIERQGKNHAIQGSNARIAKIAMGCGFSKDGTPYLWHTLPKYKARLIKFVHDELVVQCPEQYGEQVAALIGDAFKQAAAEKMAKVVMEFEYHVSDHWEK